jgi:hypothetical protein
MEQNEDARAAYMYHMSSEYKPEQLVFVDESACDQRISRGYGRAAVGHRVIKKTVFVHGKRYSSLILCEFRLHHDQIFRPACNLP